MSINRNQNPEFELITSLKNGDELAYLKVMNLYKNQVVKTVIGMIGNVQEAEDVGQEVFIRFFKNISRFKGEAKISTYLTRIAINLSLNEIERRKRRWRVFYKGEDVQEKPVPEEMLNPVEDAEKKELVQYAISKLQPEYRKVVVLRALQEYSFKEVAEILQLPIGTVLSRYSRAQTKLRDILNPVINEY